MYCEIFINLEVLIFMDFVVHLNHENKNLTKYNFPIDLRVLNHKLKNPFCRNYWCPLIENTFTVTETRY